MIFAGSLGNIYLPVGEPASLEWDDASTNVIPA